MPVQAFQELGTPESPVRITKLGIQPQPLRRMKQPCPDVIDFGVANDDKALCRLRMLRNVPFSRKMKW
jgi:hypothetical protein